MAEITKTYPVTDVEGLTTNVNNRFEVTSSAPSLKLGASNFSNPEHIFIGDLEFEMQQDGTYRVVRVGVMLTNTLKIPSEYNGADVTEIGQNAFMNNTTLKSICIPASVKRIGNTAFYGCTALESVTIEEGDHITVFLQAPLIWNNPYLRYMLNSNGSGSTTVEMTLVNANQNLYSCEIPLEAYSVSFYDGVVTNIATNSYIIPTNSPATLVFETFANDMGIVGPVATLDLRLLYDYELPLSYGSPLIIATRAFCGCTSLSNIVLPSRTGYIGVSAFEGCTSLVTFAIQPYHITSRIGEGAFRNCTHLKQVYLEKGIKYIDKEAFNGCENLEVFDFPSTLTTIGESAFRNCCSLEDFTIPASVNTIGAYAFVWDDHTQPFRYIAFEDPYTWFISKDATIVPRNLELMKPAEIYDGKTGMESSVTHYNGMRFSYTEADNSPGNCGEYYWHKLKKMPAPEISISNDGILSMTDTLGLAEYFYIYVNGEEKVRLKV